MSKGEKTAASAFIGSIAAKERSDQLHAKTQQLRAAHDFDFGKSFGDPDAADRVPNPFADSPGPDKVPTR